MPTCIYCGVALTSTTRPAHIIPEGLGGRLTSTTTVCNDCNNSFSSIESNACLRLAPFGALVSAQRGDGAAIRATVEFEGSKWHVENGRMDEKAGPPRERGRIQPMPARREEQIRTIVTALRSRKLPPEAMLDGRYTFEDEENVPPVPTAQERPVDLAFKWGDRLTKRVMIKTAVELLAYFDASAAHASELNRARRLARYNEGDDMDFRAGFDSLTEGSRLPHIGSLWFHGIDIWTAQRKLQYRMTLFTELRIVGTLTESWSGRRLRGSYTFNLRNPAEKTVDYQASDGAILVNKSRRVREKELACALERIEATNFATSARQRTRAAPPDLQDLYPDVCAAMLKR